MAITNNQNDGATKQKAAGGEVVVGQKNDAKGKQTPASTQVIQQGTQLIASMTDEERQSLGNKSGTLHYVQLLGLASKKSSRRVAKAENTACSTPVGITFVSDEDIQVPQIDINKNKETGIKQEDITYRTVKAGEKFDLSYYEYMYLIIQDQYAGLCEANGDPQGAYFSARLPAYVEGRAKLPTPTINFKSGAIKASIVDIDEQGPNGWVIKEQYAAKFGDLIRKTTPSRSAGSKNEVPTATVLSVALQRILGTK